MLGVLGKEWPRTMLAPSRLVTCCTHFGFAMSGAWGSASASRNRTALPLKASLIHMYYLLIVSPAPFSSPFPLFSSIISLYVCLQGYICVYVSPDVHMCVCMSPGVNLCVCVSTGVRMCACVSTGIHMCACVSTGVNFFSSAGAWMIEHKTGSCVL